MSADPDQKMPSRFPDPREAGSDGIVAFGGDLSTDALLDAYSHGIFPWPQVGLPLLWFSPFERGVIDLSGELRAPRKFLKDLKKDIECGGISFALNTRFEDVIRLCSVVPRPGQEGTWIIPEMLPAYEKLHRAGYAHSFEVYEGSELVGGLYGVFVAGIFSGESMFHLRSNRSKAALWFAMQYLKASGVEVFDVQMVTEVVRQFGGELWQRAVYLERMDLEHAKWHDRCLKTVAANLPEPKKKSFNADAQQIQKTLLDADETLRRSMWRVRKKVSWNDIIGT